MAWFSSYHDGGIQEVKSNVEKCRNRIFLRFWHGSLNTSFPLHCVCQSNLQDQPGLKGRGKEPLPLNGHAGIKKVQD